MPLFNLRRCIHTVNVPFVVSLRVFAGVYAIGSPPDPRVRIGWASE